MIFKKIAISTFILLIYNQASAQQTSNCNCLITDSMKYDIVWKPRIIPSEVENTGYFVKMDISKECKKKYLNKDFSFWENKLEIDSTGFSADVLLYYIYRREASRIFIIYKKEGSWSEIKHKEIEYWKDFFNQKDKELGKYSEQL